MKLSSDIAAIVTGGASGLGGATVEALAGQGVKCAIFDINEEAGNALAEKIGGVFCKVDVTDEGSVAAGFAAARDAHGQERILVNCAGIAYAIKTVARDRETGAVKPHDLQKFTRTLEVNTIGTFRCITAFAAGLLEHDPLNEDGERGVIINTASVAAEDGQIGQAAYSASKGAVAGMTLPIARDLAREGIRVNTILPGLFDTPLLAGLPEKVKNELGLQVPFPARLGKPAEYGALARHICENGMINGECIRLDGAIRMPPK